MADIRELSLKEILHVSGGGANTASENVGADRHKAGKTGARNTLGRNAPAHIYSDPSTVKCANAVFGGMIGGAIKGGPVGMARGVAGGAFTGQCLAGGNKGNKTDSKSRH